MDALTTLWSDTDVYQRRYEKAATALMAVVRTLQARRPLAGGEDEFLALYADLAAADPEIFTIIWQDPYAYFWARLAYELTGWCLNPAPRPAALEKYCAALGTDDPRRALMLHLEEFKRFLIALEMMTGRTRRFASPFATVLPLSIPGTPYSILGAGTISVIGVAGAALDVIHDGSTMRLKVDNAPPEKSAPRLVKRPVVQQKDLEVCLKPETFCVSTIDGASVLLDQPDDYQQQQLPLIRQALVLVERHHPDALAHMCELLQVIAMKPHTVGDFSNVSFSDLPGAFILSAVREPYWIADALIHESMHNRLFFILDRGEILEGVGDGVDTGEFYSPWRDDLRPLSGLLHAVYVHIGVSKFWFSVCRSGETSGAHREYAEDQAVRAILHLKMGVAQLRRHATFTARGVGLFEELAREVDDLTAAMRALNLSPLAPGAIARGDGTIVPFAVDDAGNRITVLDSVIAHAEKYDTQRQCGDVKALLNLA